MSGGTPGAETRTPLLVIGAGPCGLAVGAAARRAGVECILLDRGPVVSAIVGYPLYMTFFSTPEKLEIGGVPFIVDRDKPTRSEALKYYRRVAVHFGLEVRQYEEVRSLEPLEEGFRVRSQRQEGEDRIYHARRVVVATGSFGRPNLLDVPGEELPKVTHHFREPHPYFDQDVLVVGGGNSAVEAALSVWRAGGRVTLAHLFDRLDPGVKPWVLPDIQNRIQEGSIRALWRHRVVRIEPRQVVLRDLGGGGEVRVANDWVLAMTGFRPEPGLLREAGVRIDPDTGVPAHDPETMETDVPGLFIAGVLSAGHDANRIFIENGREHGEQILRCILSWERAKRAD